MLIYAPIGGKLRKSERALSLAEKDFLSRKEASTFLHSIGCPCSARTLEKLASNNNSGNGPPYRRFRWKQVRYPRADLIAWAEKETEMVK